MNDASEPDRESGSPPPAQGWRIGIVVVIIVVLLLGGGCLGIWALSWLGARLFRKAAAPPALPARVVLVEGIVR